MKERLNIQQYTAERHRPKSHRGPKPNRSTGKYFSRKRQGRKPKRKEEQEAASHSISPAPGQAQVCYMQREARTIHTPHFQWDIPSPLLASFLGADVLGALLAFGSTASACVEMLYLLATPHSSDSSFIYIETYLPAS